MAWRTVRATLVLALLAACEDESTGAGAGGSGGAIDFPDPLGPLAPVSPTETDRFTTSGACNQCHLAGEGPTMRDPLTNEDLSPGGQWRASMMALAARDPYYLAVFSEELATAADPGSVEALCTRCHAPAASEELAQVGGHIGMEELLTGESPAANLGREGVGCSLCHQIRDRDLGDVDSFSGGFSVGFDRKMYGPHAGPRTDPMEFFVGYTPVQAEHVGKSELCATCHTVITPVIEDGEHVGDFVEQAPYFEWLNSSYAPGTPCSSCHMPTVDSSGEALSTPIATYPDTLGAREPFGVHSFVGANAYMLTVLSRNLEWSGAGLQPGELEAAAERSARHLGTAAELTLGQPLAQGSTVEVLVTVENRTAHKLPTGYPGRRLWLHVRAFDAGGGVVFESGAWNAEGALVDAGGNRLDDVGVLLPHRDVVGSPSDVALWESVPGGWDGEPTFLPLGAVAYAKDNRILPQGWSNAGPWTKWTHPVGVGADASYLPGQDAVTYRLPGEARKMIADLVYQSLAPAGADHLAGTPTAAAVKLTEMVRADPPLPVVVASAERSW